MDIDQRCQPIELILSDVDGVLTNGRIIVDNAGVETKQFHTRDGMGIRLWQKAGYQFGWITARSSHIVTMRAAELGVEIVRQGVGDKLAAVRDIAESLGLTLEQVCYLGDDLPDLPVVAVVGLGVAVADACEELRRVAKVVTQLPGGTGAVRETIELILQSQRRWGDVVQSYLNER